MTTPVHGDPIVDRCPRCDGLRVDGCCPQCEQEERELYEYWTQQGWTQEEADSFCPPFPP